MEPGQHWSKNARIFPSVTFLDLPWPSGGPFFRSADAPQSPSSSDQHGTDDADTTKPSLDGGPHPQSQPQPNAT
jgi:hypothetical protein